MILATYHPVRILLCHLQVPLGLGVTWAIAFLLTESGVYNYKGCDINVPASNTLSAYCRNHVPRMKHCRTDTSHAIKSSPWFRLPYPLQWGTPVFSWKMAIVMCVVSIIATVDSVSFLFSLQQYSAFVILEIFVVYVSNDDIDLHCPYWQLSLFLMYNQYFLSKFRMKIHLYIYIYIYIWKLEQKVTNSILSYIF